MMTENDLAKIAVDICFKIHVKYGPGLFESVYEEIFNYEVDKTGIPFKRQQSILLIQEGVEMDPAFRADFIIDNKLIIELKSIEAIAPVHFKQVLTYLKLTNLRLGLLVNFNVNLIKDGIIRIANKL